MDLSQSTEDKINKINKEAGVIVMAYLCDIKQYCDDEKVFNEVKNYYVKVYNMDEEMINKEVDNYMNSLYKINNGVSINSYFFEIEIICCFLLLDSSIIRKSKSETQSNSISQI